MTWMDAPTIGYCGACKKQAYRSRKDARIAGRRRFPSDHVQAYQCPRINGAWHIGHLPVEVRNGQYTKDEFFGPNGAGRAIFRRKPAERVRNAA